MRNFTKLVIASAMLATQATPTASTVLAASVQTTVPTVVSSQSQIQFSTATPDAVELKLQVAPNFDNEVLAPLRARQAAEAAKAAAAAEAKRLAALAAERAKQALVQVQISAPVFVGDHNELMAAAGVSPSDFGYVDYIINHESSWDGVTRWNHSGSGAYGMFQALPGSKMAVAGADWATNPITQIRWAQGYANGRYGSWYGAYSHWLAYHSW